MRKVMCFGALFILLAGCGPNVKFIQTDQDFEPEAKPPGTPVEFHLGDVRRPYRIVGVIEAQLGPTARRPELDALLVKKAREIGADAVILVEYDIDRQAYLEKHWRIVGSGPWRRQEVTARPRVTAEKKAAGLAAVFR